MTVIIPQESGRSATIERPKTAYLSSAYVDGWRLLWWMGVAFVVMSLIDIVLGWYPLNFGSPQWEFGTISATVSALWMPTLGLYLMLSSAILREDRLKAKAVAIVMIVMALWLVALAILYATNIPIALRAVRTQDVLSINMKKSIVKWLALFVGYEALFIMGALKTLRRRWAN